MPVTQRLTSCEKRRISQAKSTIEKFLQSVSAKQKPFPFAERGIDYIIKGISYDGKGVAFQFSPL